MATGKINGNPCNKNKIESSTALPIGSYTFPNDGYVANESASIAGIVQGSNLSSGFYVYAQNRFFVRKGMNIRVDLANAIYWIPLT